MIFNVYNQNNDVIGQVEADTITDAWDGARKMFQTESIIVLDVRLHEVTPIPKSKHLREQGEWVYAKVGDTEMRGKKDPGGISFEQVSPSYDRYDLDEAVRMVEEFFGSQPTSSLMDELHLRELLNKVTNPELYEVVNQVYFATQYPEEHPILGSGETKQQRIEYLVKWCKRHPGAKATNLLVEKLEEKVKEKEQYPVSGPVAGTKYIKWEDFERLPSYQLIGNAVTYRHDYQRVCSPVTKDGYVSVDAIYNLSAWANWKSSSLDPQEMAIANAINNLHLYELMQLNHGRRANQPALFPERMLPI